MNQYARARLTAIILAGTLAGLTVAVPVLGVVRSPAQAHSQQGGSAATTTITARVAVGQEVLAAVKTNPSTGYTWQAQTVANVKVSFTDFPTKKSDPKHPLVGVPVIRVYQLTPLKHHATPYVVRFIERAPDGHTVGATMVVVISTLP